MEDTPHARSAGTGSDPAGHSPSGEGGRQGEGREVLRLRHGLRGGRPLEPRDPLGDFLRAVLDAAWTDHFHVGEGGFWLTPEEYAVARDSIRRFITELTPDGDILRVKVVSKEWAMRMAVEQVCHE